ncbi:MAG TPA: sensor histidine kinase [Gaiellaceae bacterium]|nr:sensor histidine kinase [Gaiellaceae bacterium]
MLVNWLLRHPRLLDVLLVAVAIPASMLEVGGHFWSETRLGFALLTSLPLLARRWRPVLILGVVMAATIAEEAVIHRTMHLPATLAVYTVAAHCPRSESIRAGGLAILLLFIPLPGFVEWGPPIPAIAAWLLGDNLRTRRAYMRELEARAERLEREQEESARRAAAEEQARIARELHDVLAHNVSVMVVQAAAANDVFDQQPERAREALRAIERTGRSALTELRRLLGSVRTARTEFAPQPGLAGLDTLVEGVRATGLPVTLQVEGELDDLPAGLDLSAYRIVQEALTNAIKHAGASLAEVRVRRTAEGVELEVVDDGVGRTGNGQGQGLIGMRERASLLGGQVEAGPKEGGGFRVRATLPL